MTAMTFGPTYDVTDATYIVKAGSTVMNFRDLDRPGIKVAAVNNTTTMRGAIAHLKDAKVTGYQTYDEIFNLLKSGDVDAFALAREQLNAMAKKIPGTRVLTKPLNRPQSGSGAAKSSTRVGVRDQIYDRGQIQRHAAACL